MKTNDDAFQDGHFAGFHGMEEENPYRIGHQTALHEAWNEGWEQGKVEAEKEAGLP